MKPRLYRTDSNQKEIVEALRKHGIEVTDFAKAGEVPDLLLYYRPAQVGRWAEVKKAERRGRSFSRAQLKYISQTYMDVAFVTSIDEAVRYAKTGEGALTDRQKQKLAILILNGKADYTVAQVEGALNGS